MVAAADSGYIEEVEEWDVFEGVCAGVAAPGLSGGLDQGIYTSMHVIGFRSCATVCKSFARCATFTLAADTAECSIATNGCQFRRASTGYRSYAKQPIAAVAAAGATAVKWRAAIPNVAAKGASAARPVPDQCGYCPPQNPCQEARLCRAGRCFNGLPLQDGTPCDGGAAVCIKGGCVQLGGGRHRSLGSDRTTSIAAFTVVDSTKCSDGFSVAQVKSDPESCAKQCLHEPRNKCHAFSHELGGYRRCVLYAVGTNCRDGVEGWVSGTRKEGFAIR